MHSNVASLVRIVILLTRRAGVIWFHENMSIGGFSRFHIKGYVPPRAFRWEGLIGSIESKMFRLLHVYAGMV